MRNPLVRRCVVLLVVAAAGAAVLAQERDRSRIPDKYKWNLADIYPDVSAWRAAKTTLEAELPKLRAHEGTLASSPRVLADALDHMYR
ncbi:MAG: hypothetical protein ACREUC_14240, partial [Steroidobacteraceae bacterium]